MSCAGAHSASECVCKYLSWPVHCSGKVESVFLTFKEFYTCMHRADSQEFGAPEHSSHECGVGSGCRPITQVTAIHSYTMQVSVRKPLKVCLLVYTWCRNVRVSSEARIGGILTLLTQKPDDWLSWCTSYTLKDSQGLVLHCGLLQAPAELSICLC